MLPGHADPLGGVPSLSPYSTTIPFDLLEIYKVGQESLAPSSALPIGASRTVTETQLVKLDPTNSAARSDESPAQRTGAHPTATGVEEAQDSQIRVPTRPTTRSSARRF